MLRAIGIFGSGALALGFAVPAAAQPGYGGAQVVKCESWDYRPAQCPVAIGRRADVELQRVIAGRCIEGQTWTWNRGGIAVNGGCRAIFAVRGGGGGGFPGPGGGRETVTCESWKYQYRTCALPDGGRPRLIRVVAGECVEDRSWGGRRGEVWVDKGCRAIFASARGGGGGPGPLPVSQVVTCESWEYRYAECAVQGRRVVLDSVIAGDCREGRGWGLSPRGVWVNKGCRARFRSFS